MDPISLRRGLYLQRHPEVELTAWALGTVDEWFVPVQSGFFAAAYPGDFLKVLLIDVRRYAPRTRSAWRRTHAATPWRLYVTDYDDWNVERAFSTEIEARTVVARLIGAAPLHHNKIRHLGLETA